MPAFRTEAGIVALGKEPKESRQSLQLPCGKCLGCKESIAKQWALRNIMELQDHKYATFATLTYRPETLPATLNKKHLSGFIKRLRAAISRAPVGGAAAPPCPPKIRFFAAGEYGEQNKRPHYHAILYGVHPDLHNNTINESWGLGRVKNLPVTGGAIGYVAGYCAEKYDSWGVNAEPEQIDYDTGEVYRWQPPFKLMSRRPGIGANARRHAESWRSFAILNGSPIPVPRYYHNTWRDISTDEEKEILEYEKYQAKHKRHGLTELILHANEVIAKKKRELKAAKRKL